MQPSRRNFLAGAVGSMLALLCVPAALLEAETLYVSLQGRGGGGTGAGVASAQPAVGCKR
jgi:hypothetical protein